MRKLGLHIFAASWRFEIKQQIADEAVSNLKSSHVYNMLATHLNSLPYTKFVLIQDSVQCKADTLLEYLVKNHSKYSMDYETHFLVFERDFKRYKSKFTNITCHDYSTNCRNWIGGNANILDFRTFVANLTKNCVVIVDSLAKLIYQYGIAEVYQVFNEIKSKTNIQQTITILHTDLLETPDSIVQYFNHLATLSIELNDNRAAYTFKKGHRKIIRAIEEFHFENGKFVTQAIKKPSKEMVQEAIENIIPENLSTFKIALSQKDKESKEGLVLPYLPKDDEGDSGSRIHYTFDSTDDWDEEDPDDDLDI